ncbi:hypothetical protein D3C84_981950 [compost metagenome]
MRFVHGSGVEKGAEALGFAGLFHKVSGGGVEYRIAIACVNRYPAMVAIGLKNADFRGVQATLILVNSVFLQRLRSIRQPIEVGVDEWKM